MRQSRKKKKFELDSINGKVVALIMCVKKAGATNQDEGSYDYVSIGGDGTIDLLDPGSQSLWGSGVALPSSYVQHEIWAKHFSNTTITPRRTLT